MSKKFSPASEEVREINDAVIEKWHPDLKEAGVIVDLVMQEGAALTLAGYTCAAVVRVIGLKDRTTGRGDAEIVIDSEIWAELSPEKRFALLDHELYHLNLKRGDDNAVELDDHGRPKLKMRKHDVQVGWFIEVAERNGDNSAEVAQAAEIYHDHGQILFPFLLNLDGGAAPAPPPATRRTGRRAPKKKTEPEELDPAA